MLTIMNYKKNIKHKFKIINYIKNIKHKLSIINYIKNTKDKLSIINYIKKVIFQKTKTIPQMNTAHDPTP